MLTQLTLLLLGASTAVASPSFPEVVRDDLGGDCTPACTICHESNAGGRGTIIQPFGEELLDLGLAGAGDVELLTDLLATLDAEGSDVDEDGVPDVEELAAGFDPNPGGDSFCEIPPPSYGCATSPAAPGWWLAMLALVGVRRASRSAV